MNIRKNRKAISSETFVVGIIVTALVVFGITAYAYSKVSWNRAASQMTSQMDSPNINTNSIDSMHSSGDDMSSHHRPAAPNSGISIQSMVGNQAPDFALEDLQGNLIKLSDLRGKSIVLFFNEGGMCYPACWNQIAKFGNDARFNTDMVNAFSIVVDAKSQWQNIVQKDPEYANAKILFDTAKSASVSYNVLYTQSSMHKGSYPGHTYFLIDKEGIIRYALDDPQMAIRNDLLAAEIAKLA